MPPKDDRKKYVKADTPNESNFLSFSTLELNEVEESTSTALHTPVIGGYTIKEPNKCDGKICGAEIVWMDACIKLLPRTTMGGPHGTDTIITAFTRSYTTMIQAQPPTGKKPFKSTTLPVLVSKNHLTLCVRVLNTDNKPASETHFVVCWNENCQHEHYLSQLYRQYNSISQIFDTTGNIKTTINPPTFKLPTVSVIMSGLAKKIQNRLQLYEKTVMPKAAEHHATMARKATMTPAAYMAQAERSSQLLKAAHAQLLSLSVNFEEEDEDEDDPVKKATSTLRRDQ